MKKLKTILQSKYLYLFVIIFTFIYVFLTNLTLPKSKYNGLEQNITGIVNTLKVDGNKISIELLAREKIIVNYYAKTKEELNYLKNTYLIGMKLSITGNMTVPNKNTVFNLFNYRKYLQSKKIYWIFNASQIKIISKSLPFRYVIKNMVINKINENNINSDYLYTFILGDNNFLDLDAKQSYQTNGISHLFAISSMHISLFSTIILFLLNKISKNKLINYIIVIAFLLVYAFFTNYTPSVMRTILLFFACTVNSYFKLNIKTFYLLILVCSFMLIYNPFYIYHLGFVFSFTVTFYLVIFSSLINRQKNYFSKLFMTSLIAFLVSIPISINNFFSINILSVIFNLLFVGYVSCVIFPLSLITFILPIFNPLLHFLIFILENVSIFCSKITFLNITLCHMNIYVFIGYYILITIILNFMKKENYFVLFLLAIILFIHHNIFIFNKYFIVTMIDVGQGDSILLSYPHNQGNILIDTGGIVSYEEDWQKRKDSYSIAKNKIIPYLKSLGIKKLDFLIISHGDFDHMGESINLINNFKVDKVILNCNELNELEQDLIKALNKKHIPYYSCIKNLNVAGGNLLFLNNEIYDNENDSSNVIYTKLNNYKFLFMGDAGVITETSLLEKYNLHNIDVLKVGHHGSKTSSSKNFIDMINPKYSLISVGRNNRYGHPNSETLENLNNSQIYRTDLNGSIRIKIKNDNLRIKVCSP